MDSKNSNTILSPNKNKLATKFKKVIHLKSATKAFSNNGFCLLIPQENLKNPNPKHHFPQNFQKDKTDSKNRATMEAFAAKLFATIAIIKAAYAELQIAQFPYNVDAIESADQAVVNGLKTLSEMKQSFLKKQIDQSPPHVTLLLSEIQEQQGLMRMYEISSKKLENEIDAKETEISLLQKNFRELCSYNKSLEKQIRSTGSSSVLDCVKLPGPKPDDFINVLSYTMKSVRDFVKILIQEMESANWDINAAVNAIVPDLKLVNKNHFFFVFESFVCKEMFNNFNIPNFCPSPDGSRSRSFYIDRFKNMKSENAIKYLKRNKDSTFGKFIRAKYLSLVYPKMEASFFGNLNIRKLVTVWEWPDTPFFIAFAEMARRIWVLHCLAFSFEEEVGIFQVSKKSRFSEVYMESVTDDRFFADDGGLAVAFTVVPGFKIGKTVVQSQVFLAPVK